MDHDFVSFYNADIACDIDEQMEENRINLLTIQMKSVILVDVKGNELE